MTGDDLGIAGPAQRDVAPCAVAVSSDGPVGQTSPFGGWAGDRGRQASSERSISLDNR
jgi:hypothetical protein